MCYRQITFEEKDTPSAVAAARAAAGRDRPGSRAASEHHSRTILREVQRIAPRATERTARSLAAVAHP